MIRTAKLFAIIALFGGIHTSVFAASYSGYWFKGNTLSTCGQKAVELLKSADDEGLDPTRYRFGFRAIEQSQAGKLSKDLAAAKLTEAIEQYVDDVRNGRFDPKMADKKLVMRPEHVDAHKIVSQGVASGGCQWMTQQAPPYAEYKQLKLLRQKYKRFEANGNWPQLSPGKTLTTGKRNEEVLKLRDILSRLGDLPKSESTEDYYFDLNLNHAVRRFQERHGLETDGVVGEITIKELNKTPRQRIQQIEVAMERWRWMPRNPGRRHIMVNIPGYRLQAIENDKVVLDTPIIVGDEIRETPVFTATMTGIRFNPPWNVPFNLAIIDQLPILQSDPERLVKNNFVVYQKVGQKYEAIDPLKVDWKKYSRQSFPFRIMQRPGDNNALGKIRFITNSPFNIFLHSTPYQYLFDYQARMFSSGCIRVKDVVGLASFAFDNPSKWPSSRIESEMQGTKTKEVNLSHSIPVHITYFTVFIDQSGVPHFVPDIYGQDKDVWQVIQSSKL